MKCPKCGCALPADSEFCQYCGINILEEERWVQAARTATAETHPITHTEASDIPHKKIKTLGGFICILSAVLVVSVALNVIQYLQGQDTMETITLQTSRIESLEQETATNKAEIEKLKNEVSAHKGTIIAQKSTISVQKDQISALTKKCDDFTAVCQELSTGNIGYAASNFKTSESVIVVKKNEKNRKFTLTANWSNGGTVNVKYSGSGAYVSFDNDSWSTSTKMTIEPRSEGATVVTFSNDVDSKTFKVLIIVVPVLPVQCAQGAEAEA